MTNLLNPIGVVSFFSMKKLKKGKNKKINHKLIVRIELFILAVCAVVGLYQIYLYVPGVKEAVTLATTVKPETFTELYFENHINLPNTIVLGKENSFKFTIHNLENKDMAYPYEVYIKCQDTGCNGQKQIIDQGSISIKNNQYKTISEDYNIELPTNRVMVVVNLINKNQQIDFWIGGQE